MTKYEYILIRIFNVEEGKNSFKILIIDKLFYYPF